MSSPIVTGINLHHLNPDQIEVTVSGDMAWVSLGNGLVTVHGSGATVTDQLEHLAEIGLEITAGVDRRLENYVWDSEPEPESGDWEIDGTAHWLGAGSTAPLADPFPGDATSTERT